MKYNPKVPAHAEQFARDIAWALGYTYERYPAPGRSGIVSNSNDSITIAGGDWGVTLHDNTRHGWTSAYGLGNRTYDQDGEVISRTDRVGLRLSNGTLARLAAVNLRWNNELTRLLFHGAYRNTLDGAESKESCRLLRLAILEQWRTNPGRVNCQLDNLWMIRGKEVT